ncbi:MAG: WecB/TagA/CpsF family glycosyltransferase [Candidatus Roizmanbacteria bacterium]|nr:WecB/TagA/CpsF family glycosyltransferase [Candidatus Roizmanbacteria bacterium]
MEKQRITLFQLPIDPLSLNDVLEKIKLYLSAPLQFKHIVSINPENVVVAHQNSSFLEVCQHADLALTDGIGIVIAAKLQGLFIPERVSGSYLLPKLLELAGQMSSRVVLIGSQANLADSIAKCYSRAYPKATYIGIEGYQNKLNPTPEEEAHIESIVRDTRPHFVFVAFGSPYQELWINTHKKMLQESICMGVGGAFDYLSGASRRPSNAISSTGFEWLYRLIRQPWRAKRQISRLPIFIGMVLKQLFGV